MKKYNYAIIINGRYAGTRMKGELVYAYSNTKDIRLYVGKGKAQITFSQGVRKEPETLLKAPLCMDAIKKALLVHLIRYGSVMEIKSIALDTDGTTATVYEREKGGAPLVYSLIEADSDAPLPKEWRSEEVLQTLVSVPKTKYDSRINAVIALLTAKSQKFASEKSLYLWISMNGFYNYFTDQYNDLADTENDNARKDNKIKAEWEKQRLLCHMLGLSASTTEELSDNDKNVLGRKAMALLASCDMTPEELYKALESPDPNGFCEELKNLLSVYHIYGDPLWFMVIFLPYRIRCSYFHANQAIPLFLYADDYLLKAMSYTNYFVEHYIEEHLPRWLMRWEFPEEDKDTLIQFRKGSKKR